MNKQTIYIAIFLVVIVAVIVAWVVFSGKGTEGPALVAPTAGTEAPEGGLGAEISDKAQNPIKGELPTADPAAGINPLEGVYQNPFGE